MSRFASATLGLCLIVAGIGAAGAGVETADKDSDVRAEVRRLKTHIEKLEARLEALESQQANSGTARALTVSPNGNFYVPTVPLPPDAPHIPPNADRREFNGMSYYVMPISQNGDRSSNAALLTIAPGSPTR